VWGCGYILRDPSLERQDDVRVMNRQPGLEGVGTGWSTRATVAA
jgi:hypothetical protein